jgi:RsiW-degrading membrane proteinase PrsW (M82 family)
MTEETSGIGFLGSFGLWWLVPFILLYIFGIWAARTNKIIVYRNYYDVLITGALYLIPGIFLFYLFLSEEASKELTQHLLLFALALEAALLLFIIIRSWRDNPNPLWLILALYVKIPTAIFFMSLLYSIFHEKERSNRRKSGFWLLIIMPLIYALVNDKKTGRELTTAVRRRTKRS